MTLDDLCREFQTLPFPPAASPEHPEKGAVLSARDRLTTALAEPAFLVECFGHELRLVESDCLRQGLIPFFTLTDLGIRFAFGYWSPHFTVGVHEHTAWTITAVCHNELEVLTYDRAASYQRRALVPKNQFRALAGRVGFIAEPCIHAPRNVTDRPSLSFHVISPRDGERLPDWAKALPALRSSRRSWAGEADAIASVLVARQRDRHVHQLACALASLRGPEVTSLLARCYRLATSGTRRVIAQLAAAHMELRADESRWLLERTHEDLVLGCHCDGNSVSLYVETANGPRRVFITHAAAREALAIAAQERIFDVEALPGGLSDTERTALAEALEHTGVLRRVHR